MGRVQLFEISLSHGRVVYSPGEPLAGTVRVRLGAPLPFRAIRVTCTGSCGVSNKANDAAWVVEESYFNSSLSLADKGSLPAGEHSFPFQFLLPATAPTSFEGPFGKIVHQVRATIHTPRFSKDHKCSLVFYILSPLNLNSIPDIEKVSYKAKRWIHDVRTIAEVEGAGVKAWRRAQWHEQILVPALPQSALPGCSLIHIDYYLQVSLKAPEATVTLPVFIGNIAVNHAPLSPGSGPGLPPGVPALVVPSAPPQEEAEAAVGGPHFLDPVSLSTKSHSQQQPPLGTLGSVPGAPEPDPQDGSPAPHPLHPLLCISTGATVPYFAEGSGGPVPTTSTLILPPEYSSWGYPYGELRARAGREGTPGAPCRPCFLPAEAPPSYEQSCGGVDPSLTPES
ncbi:arrestin domain-containing protein 1 isoform X4 [Sapajus apella]|uniref:Arrestin domain-containing protein 1 isoform X4 n=1 Tax=Sapajus apella TaxID=9515 RepID=A0A6J3HFW5_SAPAP|nr:arrestin domain-containing protein 1 isoform X4 [Sapajus apella]